MAKKQKAGKFSGIFSGITAIDSRLVLMTKTEASRLLKTMSFIGQRDLDR